MSWRVHVHSAHLTNKALSLRENDLVLLMFATHVMMHSQTCAHTHTHAPCFTHGEMVSLGQLSKRFFRTPVTFTVVSREGSRFDTSPLDSASATFAELGTRSYQARMSESHSQASTCWNIRLSTWFPPRPDTRRCNTASLSTKTTRRSFWKMPSDGSSDRQPMRTARAFNSKMIVSL